MKRNLLILLALSCCVVSGCAAVFTGAAAVAGVYTYFNGQLTRSYQAPFDKTNLACTAALESLKIAITEEASDGINTTIKAKRTDGTPLTVKTVMIEPRITEVSVRSGVVGIWDKKVSELIHASIAQRLQK
ncbi:MAG: DUF3568 family protein [Pseudomonadota bacterium]|uniref:DUF3568 family protein n=1 Tax=Candidatus Desulfatibia profunda TaxID=2841695 RepID=A0A8J6NPE7_9BACT|nr:DUF3568 family protein [Candidatus Desulfatibia profunda]MBL7180737.1 DUF3568 family protein [Desulfobacterales bacterium]